MINHHPSISLLTNFVMGDLPASLSAAVVIHADMCESCAKKISQLTEQQANECFMFDHGEKARVAEQTSAQMTDEDLSWMIEEITADEQVFVADIKKEVSIQIKDDNYILPAAIQNMDIQQWSGLGKISRARIELDEDEIHTSLLHMAPGGSVPEHTHKGFELTLLLAGSFEDETGKYVPGDFIWRDSQDQHTPQSPDGCLCYTVSNDALKFTKGLGKLLNPIGGLIY